MSARRPALCLVLAALAGNALATEPLGRLFFSPEKRDVLDRQRALNALSNQQVAEDPQLTINGQIRRSTGKQTTWINGLPQDDEGGHAGVVARSSARGPEQVILEAGDEPTTTLRVGETFNRGTHETSSAIGDGKIVIKPGAKK